MTAVAEERSIFENEEWLVTQSGLEHKTTGYFIERSDLAYRRGDGLWTWPLHMAEKSWCAMAPFAEAFSCAASVYDIAVDLDLARTFKMARCEVSPWPRPAATTPAPVPSFLQALRTDSAAPILVERETSGKAARAQDLRGTDKNRRTREAEGHGSYSAHARLRPSRFDLMHASPFAWRAPRRIRSTGTKLVRLLRAAWIIK